MATLQGQYKAAIKHGLLDQSVTEEQFAGILGDPKQRKAYYDNSNQIKQGAYGTYDSFSKAADEILAAYRQPQAPATAEPVATPQVPTMPVGAAADSTDAAVAMLMDSNRKQQEQDKKELARINNAQLPMSDEDIQRDERIRTIDNTLKQVGVERFANRQPIGDAREDVLQQQQQLEQERTALQGQRKSYMKEPETIEEARENWTNAWMENTEEGKQAKREADEGYQQAVDYLRNEFIKSKTHQDIVADVQNKYNSGALTEDEANAELNKRLNDAFIAENKETLEAEYKTLYGGLAERAYEADNGWLKKQEERIQEIAVADALSDGKEKFLSAWEKSVKPINTDSYAFIPAGSAGKRLPNEQQIPIELSAALQLYQQAEIRLNETKKGDEQVGDFTKETLRHFRNVLPSTLTLGISDVANANAQKNVLEKIAKAGAYDNPESVLTENELVLYDAIVANIAAETVRAENTSHLAKAGQITADMIPFVMDIAIGKGLFSGMTKAAQKGVARGVVRALGNGKWRRVLARQMGDLAGGLVESAAIAAIAPSTYKHILEEEAKVDPRSLQLTDEGWKVGKIDTQTTGDAIWNGYRGNFREIFTETGGLTQFAAGFIKASPLGKLISKTPIGKLSQIMDNNFVGKMFKQTAYHGIAGEMSEEWENTFYEATEAFLKAPKGEKFDAFGKVYGEFVSPETQVPMLISFSVPAILGAGLTGTVRTGQILYHNAKYKQAYENLRNTYMKYGATEEEFEDALNELRAARMNMNIEDYPQLISGLAATLSGGSQEQADELAAALSAYTVADANLGAIQEKHAKKQRQVQQLIRDIQASEERITSNTHADSGMMYHVNVNGQAGYVVSGGLQLNTYDNAELPVAVNSDIVTVRMEDGSVKQVAARDVQLLEQPQSAEGAMEFERRRLTARMNNLDRFKVGDVIYMTENGQPIDGSSSRVVDVTDEGVVAEIIDPNGQPNTTVIPHEVAESGLSTSDELVEDGVESVVLEMNNGSLITMQKTTSGDWMQVAPKDDSMTLWSQEDLDEFIAKGGAKIVNGEQAPSLEVASGNGVVSEETGEISVSELQRRFGIGYNQATDIINQLVSDGIVEQAGESNYGRPIYKVVAGKENELNERLTVTASIEQPTEQFQAEQPAKPYATDEQGNPAWAELDVEQSVGALLSEMEDDKELSKQFAQSQIAAAKSALNKANKRKPQATTDLAAFRAEAQAIKQEQQAAQAELSKWENILLGIANYKTAEEQAAAEQAAAQAAAVRAQRKQTIEGVGGTNMAERLAASPRIDGNAGSITAADGTKIPGHYVLVSANALTPSHNPNANFAPSAGYPTVDGQSINDRDYQADREEQAKVQQVAQTYDGRAITNMPIVSDEGLVYSGNGRTMAGQLAAANGTDGAYTEALLENATQFGFTAEQVESVPNARVVFMTDERLPYNTTTLALFNQTEQQTQSNTASAAANVRKLTPEAVGHIIAAVQEFDTVDAFFGDSRAPFELVNRLIADGIISERDKAAFVDNGRLTATGKDRLTALLFGTAFDEKTIRLLGDNAKVRNSVMRALPQILENKGLGDFSLFEHINNAIQAIYDMDTNKMSFFEFTRQIDIEGKTASDKYTAFELRLVDAMTNGGVQAFRDILSGFNTRAKESAGGQMDLFTGEVLTIEELTKQILQEYEQREANERGGAQLELAESGVQEGDGEEIDTQTTVEQIKLTDGRVVTLSTITDKDFALLGDITPIQRSLIAVRANAVQKPDLKLKTAGYCNTTRRLLFNELPSEKKDLPTLRDIYFRTQQEYVNTPNKTQEYRFAADEVLKEIRRRLSYLDPENYPPKQGSASVSRLNDAELAVAEAETDTNPTEAQKKAENYKQGHVTLWGLPFTIENPKGSVRRGTDANGKQWEQVMNNTYGKIRRTEGVDGDHIDVFFGPNLQSDKVFVVDQLNVDTKEFDEHKVMLGFDSMEEAQAAYLSNYEQGWQGMGPVTETTMDEFKKWIESSHRKTKPFNEYKSVKQEGAASGVTTPVQKSVSSGKKASNKTEKTQGSVQNSAQLEQKSVETEQKNAKSNEKTQSVGKNTVFTDEMLETARQRMRSRMNRLNAGIDPEMLADGIVFAGYYVEKGVRKFADFAKNMIAEFGDSIRPYLKAFYNGLRDMPGAQAFVSEMDDYASVAAIDVNTITLDEQVQPSTEQVQPKQVSVEGLFNDLNRRGTAKLSDNVIGEEPAYIKNYREIKEQYPDALVLFRAGDFYEVYLEDAQEASKILGITLTNTGNYPLAGFPFHALDSYLPKLVRAGKRVAIAEKVKDKPEVVETVGNQTNLAQNLQESEKNSNFAENIENNEQDNENLQEGVGQSNAEPSEVRGGAEESARGTTRKTTDDGRGDGRVRSLASTLSTLGDKTAQEEYLKQSDLWLSPNEIEISRDLSKGKESQVYVSKDKKAAIKLVDYSIYSETPFDFVRERVELFNQLFPKTAYTIVGVTERNGKLNFVLSQPLIRGKVLEDSWWGQGLEVYESFKPRLDEMMRERFGMENYGLDAYQNELIRVQDLHYKNIIVDENGEWQVVDAVTTYREAPEDKGTKKDEPLIVTDAVGEITKSTDTRDGSDIWLVNPTDRVSKEEFAELKKRAKAHNGYYSNFKQNRGFLFRTEGDAIAFNRINENELTTDEVLADTGLVIGEAETRRNEAETIAESTRVEPSAPTTGEAIEQVAKAEQQINAAMTQLDETTEQVNDQLMLLGYYKSESDANEWGLSKKAEKAALKDVDKVANLLAKDLGVEGKIKASANIAPAGGEITFRIPLLEGRELHVYIPIHLNAGYYRLTGNYSDLYIPDLWGGWSQGSILYRVDAEDRYGMNYYARGTTTYNDFLNAVRYIAKDYLPQVKAATAEESSVTPELQTPLEKAKARQAKQKKAEAAQPAMGDLFAGTLFAVNEIEESINQQNTQNNENEQQPTRRTGSSEPTTGNVRSGDRQQSVGVRSEVTIQEDTRPTDGGGATEVLRDEREESRSGLPLHAIEQEPLPENQKKNKRNNNVKRGVDYAPKTAKERFEANIAAIQLLKELEESGKQATPAQMKVLRKFTGWGGLGSFFPDGYISPTSDAGKLKQLLTPEEYDAANLSRNSAYFTPGAVIDRLWDIAAKFGFQGGNITEGSAGTGEILARIPQAMNERSEILAVEIDPITGGILKQLYPDARVEIDGFQNVSIPNGSQDLVITNVPFVRDLRVFDKEESDLSKRFTQIQDFCIAKNIRKLREGGLGIFIAGKSSLDSSKDLRKWIVKEGNCDVVGAFRLNKDTFNGTSATADIIVVKKRVNGVVSPNAIDILDVETIKVDEVEVDTTYNSKTRTWEPVTKRVALAYNQHYVQHPEDMGGEMALGKDEGDTRFGGGSSACYPRRNINQMQRLDDWIANMGKGESMMPAPVVSTELKNYEDTLAPQGSIILNSKDEVCIANRGKAEPLDVNSNKVKGQTKQQVVKDYLALKRIVHELLEVQEIGTDAEVKSYQKVLNERYDSFVKKYGYLNKNTALSFLRNDVEYPSIAAIEKYEEIETPKGKEIKVEKTDIFKKRVIGVKSEPTPTNTRDAVVLSVQQFGRLDLAQMAEWLNMSEEAVRENIVKERLGFVNPETQQLQIRHEYLSGNVRQKLAYAQAHNENGEYTTNIEELQKVIPMDIPAHLIEFSVGSTWIDPKMYEDFVREKYDVSIKYSHIGGVWSENGSPYLAKEKNRAAGVHSDLLNMHVFGNELFISAMNNVPYIVSKQETYYEGGQKKSRTVTDKNASQACATRIDEIRDEFTEWARQHMQQDAELAQRMERVYNDKFNAIVPMDIDEQFTQAFLPGMNPNTFPLYPIQQKAIVRGTMQPVLLTHEVGTGKTRSLICTAMEMRRLGTAKKPLIVVQNATVMQFVNEAKELFPNAKVLTVNEKDRTSEGRREFYAKIKYNDWDMVIIPQSVFDMIPDSDERKRDFIQEKVDEKLHVLEQAREADMDSRQVKNLERELASLKDDLLDLNLSGKKQSKKDSKKEQVRIETAEARAEEMLARRTDDVADFDQMGIDALLVDEAHNYKHLGFATMMQRGVKGIDPSYSKRAAALYLKVQSVFEQSGGKNVIFATGTPISNTAAEIWTFMKYLMPKEVMQENDIYYFDDFVRNFGKISQSLEFATNGKFKENTRFASYVNIPELARIWGQITDTRLTDEVKTNTGKTLKEEKIPTIEGGKQTDIFLEQSDSLVDIMNAVRSQLEEYENMSGAEKKEHSYIPLTMYGIAKRAAIDPRLVDASAKDEPESKTNKAVEETLRALKDSKKYNGTVAIFCDNYRRVDTVNGKRVEGFNIFEEIRNKLIQRGVPADQIVIMRSGMTDKAKQQVFDAMNAGSKRVILGSTQTLGTGVNIQTRLFTLIHMDAPDRPMDMTQREGRILRQGNMHKIMGIPVRILRFGVKDSLDVTGYQRLQTKSRFIDSIMRSKDTLQNNQEGRVIEEDEEGLYDNPVAVLSGSQYALLKSQAEREYRKLLSKQQQHNADQIYIENQLRNNALSNKRDEDYVAGSRKRLAEIEKLFPNGKPKAIVVNGVKTTSNESLEKAVKEYNKILYAQQKQFEGQYNYGEDKRDLKLTVSFDGTPFDITIELKKRSEFENGQRKVKMEKRVFYSCTPLNIEKTPADNTVSLQRVIEEIRDKELSGIYDRQRVEAAEQRIARRIADNEEMQKRRGKQFELTEELADAKKRVDEYTELMKQELAEQEAKYANRGTGAAVDLEAARDTEDDSSEAEMMIVDSYDDAEAELTEAQQIIFDGLAEVAADAGIDIVEVSEEDALKAIENSGNKPLTNPINGKILGYAQVGTIYLTKAGMTPETVVHEYTHVWAKAMQRNNRAGWENIMEIFKQSPLWEYVKNDPNYKGRLTTDDAICSEVLARFSGKQGAERLNEVASEFINEEREKGGMLGAARVRQFINHARQAIKSFWKWVGKNLFGITKFDSMEDVADRVLYDLLNATELDVDRSDNTIESSIEMPSEEFRAAMRAWNDANPYPTYTEGESLGAFSDRLTAWKEARDAYRAELWRKSQEKIEDADPITEPMVAGSKPVRKKDETPLEYAQRLKQWQNAQIDSQLSEEYTAEMNRLAGTLEKAKRAFVDAALPIEAWQKWLIEHGATMTSESNAYQDMFLAQGRVSNAAEELRRDIIQKLTRKIAAIIESKKLDDVDLRWKNMDVPGTKRTINGNKLSVRELIGVYCQAKDCEEAEEKGLPDRGKAGFKNNLDVEYTDIVNAVETRLSREDITELWHLINQATKYALDYDLASGRISQDTYDEFADREYYVPQRGWRERDESGLIEEYEPVGKRGHDPYNAALVKARGRQSLAADPFAYIMSIDHSSIVSSENNKIKQKMLQFCLDNEEIGLKTGAFRVKKYWLMHEIDPDTGKIRKDEDGVPITLMSYTEPKAEDFKHDKQVKDEVKRIEKEIAKRKKALEKELAEHGDTNYAKALQRAIANSEAKIEDLNDTLIIAFGATNTHISQRTRDEKLQHEVQVMKDGQRYVIELQDEKVANAINKKFKQHQEALFDVSDKMRNATRFMSAMLTQYNPEFAVSNFVRDFQVAVMTLANENPKLLLGFAKNFILCQRAVMAYAFADKVKDRTKYVDSDMGGYLREYMASGAPTGFSYMQDLKTLRKDFDSMVNEGKLARGVRSAAGIFSMFTEISETAVRFAAYVSAREAGWKINDAAYMSKELTTNFDRAGEMADSGWMSWFSFMRATINGNVKFFRAFKKLPIAYSITAAVFFAMGIINQFANPNDPEDEVWASDFVRENNFVIGKWRIPVAHFMRIFYSAGVNMASWMQGERTFGHAVYNSSMSAFNEILPNYMNIPGAFTEWSDEMERVKAKDPKAVIRELAPTPISPFVDVWANRNFMGGTINREPFVKTQENTKDILMAKDNTLPIYRAITEGIYTAVGGDLNSKYKSDDNAWTALFDVSGSSLEHITEGYLTGGMDMLATTANMIYDAVQGNELTPDKITFIRKFYNQYTPQRAYDQQYWLLKGRVQEYQRKLNDYEENNPDKYELETRSKQYKAYEETNELIWEKIENPTTEDVKQLMEANKQWTKASK